MSIYFKEWRKKYVMLFKSFLKNKYKNYYNSLYFVGGTQFELDNDLKFEDKLYNLYTSDIDCVIFIEDKDENDFKEKIKEFYEDFKLFIDENTDKETINLLQNLKIKDIKSNSYWKISNDVKKDLSFYNIFLFILLRDNGISDEGAKEIAQNFIHLKGLKEFHLNLQ